MAFIKHYLNSFNIDFKGGGILLVLYTEKMLKPNNYLIVFKRKHKACLGIEER